MSKALRFDPPLVRALAAELNARLAGRTAHAVPLFDRDRSVTLLLDRGEALRWDLHPERGWLAVEPVPTGLAGRTHEARITRVSAPPDERLLHIDFSEGSRFRGSERRLVVELHTNQWNAVLVDRGTRQILSVLRGRDAGDRILRPGETYRPPPGQPRRGRPTPKAELRAGWRIDLEAVPAAERQGVLLRGWADVSSLNANAILGTAGLDAASGALDAAFDRWWRLHTLADPEPVILEAGFPQPYPSPLPGLASRPAASLIEAFAAAASHAPASDAGAEAVRLLPGAQARLGQLRHRLQRLRDAAPAPGAAERVRATGDLLLAHLEAVPAGAERVVLPGFDGVEVEVALDPTLRPHQNADAYYERARRMSRAEARLPALIGRGEAEVLRWEAAVEALRRGETPSWLPEALEQNVPRRRTAAAAPRVPYRSYRTSGGLEVRVGRSRADNDRLTFGHSSPDDVWLHARQVPGSHVVLRWAQAEAPPARDLAEAAALAAWHSRARTSQTVPVDWTRRRYVRKPRGAPPGRVALLRGKTLFVQPADRDEVDR